MAGENGTSSATVVHSANDGVRQGRSKLRRDAVGVAV